MCAKASQERDSDWGSPLGPYRVLDIADEKGLFCGKIMGALGADVIKVEKPDGDHARSIGPFYKDIPDPEKSLFWFAFNTDKRGITLNIETRDGRDIFKRLAKRADFIIESFSPGYMDTLGLGYSTLREIKPSTIMVSITPFGQEGPRCHYKGSDLVCMALGGFMTGVGDPDRSPLRIAAEQAYCHAGCHGAAGALIALYHRQATGEGQHIDVSIQDCVVRLLLVEIPQWDIEKGIVKRSGQRTLRANLRQRQAWHCKDGYVAWTFHGGPRGWAALKPLIDWVEAEGGAGILREIKGPIDLPNISQEKLDSWEEVFGTFFLSHTKDELFRGAVERRIHLLPANDPKDIMSIEQLASRNYWVELEHPELGDVITYPGPFVNSSENSCRVRRRAPLIGEHNEEVYVEELGFSRDELVTLKQFGII